MSFKKSIRSLTGQLLLFIVILFFIPLLTIGISFYVTMSNNLTSLEEERMANSSESAKNLIDNMGNNLLGVTQSNSYWNDHRVAIIEHDIEWLDDNVSIAADVVPNVHFVAITDSQGNVITQTGDLAEFNEKVSLQDVTQRLETDNNFYGLVETSKGITLLAVSKVTDESGSLEPSGVLYFGQVLDEEALLVNKNILHTDLALLSSGGTWLSTSSEINKAEISSYESELSNEMMQFKTTQLDDVWQSEMVTAIEDISGNLLGMLVVSSPSESSGKMMDNLIFICFLVSGIVAALFLLLIVLLRIRVIRPLIRLSHNLEDVAEGDLTSQVDPAFLKRKDEVGEIANSTQNMLIHLRTLIGTITESVHRVASSSQQLSASSELNSHSVNQINIEINEMASGGENQVREAESSALAVREMAKGTERIVDASNSVFDIAKFAMEVSQKGNESLEQVMKQMDLIHASASQSGEVIQGLGQRSQEIGQIVDLIKNIASQTTLLAFNAAIEAARAGEHGRGFSVVADEVRKLAEQSDISANQIEKLIRTIVTDTKQAVEVMEIGAKEVNAGIERVKDTSVAFEQISDSVMQVTKQVEQMSETAKQLSELTAQVSIAAEHSEQIAREAADSAQTIVASTAVQLASMEEISGSAASLSHVAMDLQDEVDKFKL